MIDLVVNYERLSEERCWDCPQRPLQLHVGFLEITLLVCGILTALEVGPFGSLSSSYTIAFFTTGGTLIAIDVGALLKHYVGKREQDKLETPYLKGMKLFKQEGTQHDLIDLSEACKINQAAGQRPHLYRVYSYQEMQSHSDLRPGHYLLFFRKSGNFSVSNVSALDSQGKTLSIVALLPWLNMPNTTIFPNT